MCVTERNAIINHAMPQPFDETERTESMVCLLALPCCNLIQNKREQQFSICICIVYAALV